MAETEQGTPAGGKKRPARAKELVPGIVLPRYELPDVAALQAISKGEASAEQQVRALKWILNGACMVQEWAFVEGQRQTDVALGRQMAGQMIYGLLKLPMSELRKRDET